MTPKLPISALALLGLSTAAFQVPSLDRHTLNGCQVDIGPAVQDFEAQVYYESGSGGVGVELTLFIPQPVAEMADWQRSTNTHGDVRSVQLARFVANTATFTPNSSDATKYDLVLSNGTDTETFPLTQTTGSPDPLGPLQVWSELVNGPGGDAKTLRIWVENKGLRAAFTLTDV